jgi:hypothetical protein
VNIFVETNFVIEVALDQQEVAACEALLLLAAEDRIRLFNCKYFSSFATAVQYITHALGTTPSA